MIPVELYYAISQNDFFWVALQVPEKSTVKVVIIRSGILKVYPNLFESKLEVGIFSTRCSTQTVVNAQDRVEIYSQLAQDPKEARRARAQ